jgi:hypothetical protein
MGVAVVGAMALGVSVLAAPRGADEAARGTGKSGTEVTRLVTGDPAQINAVVAGVGATAKLRVTPVLPPAAASPVNSYPAGCSISGNALNCDRTNKDVMRAWFNVQVEDWDPSLTADPNAITYQVQVDCAGYVADDDPVCAGLGRPPLAPAVVACSTAGVCTAGTCVGGSCAGAACAGAVDCAAACSCRKVFGESFAKCTAPLCDPGYGDFTGTGRPDSWCALPEACNTGAVGIATCNYKYFAVSDVTIGTADGGAVYHGGTLVLDIPAGAKGKYTVNLDTANTFIAKPVEGGEPEVLPSMEESGFVVNMVTGACCFGLGTATPGCIDNCINRSDCEAQPGQRVFTPGAVCDPDNDGDIDCAECTVAADGNPGGLCDDDDACTVDSCDTGLQLCNHANKAGFDPTKPGGTKCCDKASGNLTNKDDGIFCTVDGCSEPNNRGIATHVPAPAGPPGECSDNNPCSSGDHCAGPPSISCTGTDINTIPCTTDNDCPIQAGLTHYACTDTDGNGSLDHCFCTLTPPITFEIPIGDPKLCDGGLNDGQLCATQADCPGGTCVLFGPDINCFDEGDKITANVHIGASGAPITGGQFLIHLELGSCLKFNSITCLAPYTQVVSGPIVNEAAGTIFIACALPPFGGGVGAELGNVDMLSLSFTKIGDCNQCDLCFGTADDNPYNTYLVDDEGQRVPVDGGQCKSVRAKGVLELNVPDSFKTNADCDGPTAVETWPTPNATHSCSDTNITCRGAHTSGYEYPQSTVLNGGELLAGESSFCCFATAKDLCGGSAGCDGDTNGCVQGENGKPEGCWTVEVNDETSLDIDVQLCPNIVASEITRCIKFCLFSADCAQEPICFSDDVTFGLPWNFIGKSRGKVKVPGTKQWGCITAQDQLHTLRSCYTFGAGDCDEGQLHAQFSGAHEYDGNCLLGGNLDGWKKAVPGSAPSLDTIDILDYGTFVSQFGICYDSIDTPCPAVDHGPNADINGDGCVTSADYNFIINNFLTSVKDCCCGPQASSLPPALVEVTVDELRQMGYEDLIVADLNGDGVLNAQDMEAFMQGARPAKSNDRKGGKGLRSGR